MSKPKSKSGVPSNHYGRWGDEEKAVLREYWPKLSVEKIQEAFPGRTKRAVIAQAALMGLRKSEDRLKEMGRENISKRWVEPE